MNNNKRSLEENEDFTNIYDYVDHKTKKIKKEINSDITIWVSGSQITNYLLNDPIIDWLNLYYSKYGLNDKMILRSHKIKKVYNNNINNNINNLLSNGILFEDKIYNDLLNKFGDDCVYITNTKNKVNDDDYNKTLDHINKQTPIILQAYLKSDKLKLKGIIDILVRSDYINKLTKKPVLSNDEIYCNNKLYYLVIDIKWSHMTLCVDGKTIRNDGRFKAYKGQLLIYNLILSEIQNYMPRYTFIMPKSWNIDKKDFETEGYSCYDRLGYIDYLDRDSNYIEETIKGINWIRNVRNNGYYWSPLYPHIKEMYCNASNTNDMEWNEIKKNIIDNTKDITKIWMITPNHRNKCIDKGIKRWDDKKLNIDIFEMNDGKRKNIIDQIIKINQQDK